MRTQWLMLLVFCTAILKSPWVFALDAGAFKVDLVPPFPTKMAGYFDRHDSFTGVDTPIYARALVCSNDEMTLGVVVVDLCYVTRELTDLVRVAIQKKTGIPSENILISATHTHSGPSGFAGSQLGRLGEGEDNKLTNFLVKQITQSVVKAHKEKGPAHIGFAYGHLDSLTRNRQQNNNEVIDPQVGVLKVQKKDSREMIAVLANFTGHPVILGGNNLLLSSEYPGQACRTVEESLGGVALVTQGACGDITMHRNGSIPEEVTRIGRILGGEIIKTTESISVSEDNELFSQVKAVKVEAREMPTLKEAAANIKARKQALEDAKETERSKIIISDLQREVNAANTTFMVAQKLTEFPDTLEHSTNTSIQVSQIGPMVMVAIPGEMFVEFQLEMKQRIHQDTGKSAVIVGYANDYIGYIITPRANETGGYEKAISKVSHTAGRTLTEAAIGIVRESLVE